MERQIKLEYLGAVEYRIVALVLTVLGFLLVLSSGYQLGVAGTFLGDYFGILHDKRVTGFPFNILDDPMYDGSSMIFLGKAIMYVRKLFSCENALTGTQMQTNLF